ncbi:MAG: molecular chaperone HtpG [Desulfobacteraceae bacterium]|nr:MAG: molecular chaperone HtpG [Desulfobacteraceae bacterium]
MTMEENQKVEKLSFQAETKELLNLMVNSLYTHKEIFLRELISNASDALDKVRFQSLTDRELLGEDKDLKVTIDIQKDQRTLTISDNGIGMTYQEVIDNIGTIARSGTKTFLEQIKETKDLNLIGQFGVGFYSSFMVSKKVTLLTRAAHESEGTRWESAGDGTFTIEKTAKSGRGTQVILHLKDQGEEAPPPEEDFLNQYTIQNLVKKYSNYIQYPVEMEFQTENQPRDKDGKIIPDAKPEIKLDKRVVNSMIPIWKRNKSEITHDEYFQFYKHHFHDWEEFADLIHIDIEGKVTFTALLFIPSKAPLDFYSREYAKGIQLYSNHVFIMNDCRDVLPNHFSFVRGLIDSPDFSLNISREILQHDTQLKVIRKTIEKKVLDALKAMLADKRDKYDAFWKEFGKAIKGGLYMEWQNKEILEDLLLFSSSHDESKLTTLQEYVARMPETQKEIYYAPGKDLESIRRMPQLEIFKEKKIEVLYFADRVDEFLTHNLDQYKEKKLKSVTREDFDLGDLPDSKKEEKTEAEKKDQETKDESPETKALLESIKNFLGNKVKDVKLSKRLKSSPVCLVNSNTGVTFNMEHLMKGVNQITPPASKILEINPNHEIYKTLKSLYEKDKNSPLLKQSSEILYHQAMLIEGYELDNPQEFSKQLTELMISAYKNQA